MNIHANKRQEHKSQSVANGVSHVQSGGEPTFQFVDNRAEVVAQRRMFKVVNQTSSIIQESSPMPIQRVFALGDSTINNSALDLINMTAAGQAALAQGVGSLYLQSTSDWKTLTLNQEDNTLGVGIKAVDYNKIENVGTTALTEDERKDYSARLAHEIIHLTHYQSSKNDFEIMGQRDPDWDLEAWGDKEKWDSDPEEELTIKGQTRIKIPQWNIMARKKYENDKYMATQKKLELDGIIALGSLESANNLARIKKGRAEQALPEVNEAITLLEVSIANPPAPEGSVTEDEVYIITKDLSENIVRAELELPERVIYSV